MSTEFSADEWISQAEAARLRNVSRQAIAKLVKARRLRQLTIGGRTLVNKADVIEYVPHKPGRPRNATRSGSSNP